MGRAFKVGLLLLVVTVCAGTSTATAAPFVAAGDSIKVSNRPGDTGGGEFSLMVNGSWSFISFCLQRTQYIDYSNVFHVDAVSASAASDAAAQGGDAAGRDYLSPQTAFLYTRFRKGNLADYIYSGAGQAASADRLQNAIWMFEQELPMDVSNAYVIMANNAVLGGQWSGIGNVRALNLSRNGVGAQDQLALVPEPAEMTLLGIGLISLGWAIRRRGSGTAS